MYNQCKAKLSSSLYAIRQSRQLLTSDHLLMLYNTLIYPYLTYGVLLWGSTHQTYIHYIVTIQKKAVRAIAHAPYNAHTHHLFQRFKILKFQDIYRFYLGKYMYQQVNYLLPEPLLNKYYQCQDIHPYKTRQANQLHKQSRRTVKASNSFINKGLDHWNRLPNDLKDINCQKYFNKKHKIHLHSMSNHQSLA